MKSQNRSDFCCPSNFARLSNQYLRKEFFYLRTILCNFCPIMRFQMKFSITLWTKKQRKIFSPQIYREFHLKYLAQDRTRIAQNQTERQKNSYLKNRSDAWQNRTDSLAKLVGHDKNWKHHCLCKWGVTVLFNFGNCFIQFG